MGSTQVLSSNAPLQTVTVAPGRYLRFESVGEFPDAVIKAWQTVWQYFVSPTCRHTRAYTTDFECYESADKVAVFIALK
ncbi:GyrI-like domain-containing protein [Shewanella sp. NIFS-20-20]|uniref:GyrI-like domain-containing protein n=1 Tax=Shewanella sp. NIFS-20-20 TaxID=2853806 RepID=UPI001C45741C|nr:GyrI-like domain-containing protein [Shewanella sp. NIFS-20-20]MBV7317418.1 GyrI-like domain-containing protein [Shewanella sp. NIFS-20-20]